MAITIHQQPDAHSAISTPLIVTASSTNSGNDGFKYVVRVNTGITPEAEYIFSANPNGYLIFDVAPTIRPFVRNCDRLIDYSATRSIHGLSEFELALTETPQADDQSNGVVPTSVTIYEGWNIAGEFTINEGSLASVDQLYIYNFQDFTTRNGYKPSLLAQIGHEDGDQSRVMSDRLPSTYYWQFAETVSLNLSNTIYIPTREADYGVFSVRGISVATGITEPYKVLLRLLPNSGPPIAFTYIIPDFTVYSNLTMYPANLNESPIIGILKPSDYPNWKAIYFQILNEADEQVSMTYVMFNVDRSSTGVRNCHDYEVVRLAWVGRRGGWEYQNFMMLSEVEYNTDQKIAKKVVGNYGAVGASTDFTFNTFDENEFVAYKKIEKFVTCSTDILQPGEWEFLKGLVLSKQVHWVHDDGTHTPVIVQDNNFKVRNIQAKAREALTIKFKVAQDQSN